VVAAGTNSVCGRQEKQLDVGLLNTSSEHEPLPTHKSVEFTRKIWSPTCTWPVCAARPPADTSEILGNPDPSGGVMIFSLPYWMTAAVTSKCSNKQQVRSDAETWMRRKERGIDGIVIPNRDSKP
jgi:hypothetical protein